jgi:hypothetical protein
LLSNWECGTVPDLEDVARPAHFARPDSGCRDVDRLPPLRRARRLQERAFKGESEWTPQRVFERVFERLALPGFGRRGRYDLLITLGRLGLYEMRADSLHLGTRTSSFTSDPTPQAAKRRFGIGDPIHIECRGAALAQALSTPIEVLDLALYNWSPPSPSGERVTLGLPADTNDAHAAERATAALEIRSRAGGLTFAQRMV